MIAPQMPTGGLVRQVILDDESHGQGDDAVSVMGFGPSVVGHVGVEVFSASCATVLGIKKEDVAWPTGDEIADVMQDPRARSTTKAGFAAPGTTSMLEVSRTVNDLGLRKIIGTHDTFRGIGQIQSWSEHGKALLGTIVQPRNLQELRASVTAKCLFCC